MFVNILMTIVIAAIAAVVAVHFTDEKKNVSRIVAECLGVGVGLVALKYLASRFPEFSWLVLIIIVAFIGGLMYQWHKQGSEPIEFACFAALTLIAGGVARVAAANYTSATIIPLLIVVLISIFAIGFYGFTAFKFHRERNVLDDDERKALLKDEKKKDTVKEMDKKATKFGVWMTAVAIATLVALAGATGIVLGMADSGLFEGAPDGADVTRIADTVNAADTGSGNETETASATNWHFYNNDVQGGDEADDFNFGPEPDAETATELDADFRERLENDPALGAADIAWADAWLGTRYLGEFYESCNEDWAKTINAAKEAWIKDPDAYAMTLDAFFQFLNTAEVKVTPGNGLEDQMYMNPYTTDGTPDVIVLATPDHNGKFLTYLFTIKGTGKVKVSYRIECGYQPTNVEEVMGITPQSTPSKGTPSKGTPGKGDNPTPTPTPTPEKNKKDQSKIPKKNTEPNDDKGPGEKTIGNDPNHSTKDRSDNSTSGSYQDYQNNQKNLEDTNKSQKTGSDSSKPSTPAPSSNTNVDNNGGKINTPTPTKEPETVKNDPAAGTMSEPS